MNKHIAQILASFYIQDCYHEALCDDLFSTLNNMYDDDTLQAFLIENGFMRDGRGDWHE
jgi:hypothetical protein